MENKNLISIGKIDKYIFYPIIGGIFKFIVKIILTFENLTILTKHSLMGSLVSSLGMCFSLFLLLFYKYRTKAENAEKNNSQTINKHSKKGLVIELEYTNEYETIIYDKIKYIFITSVIDFIITILIFEFCIEIKINMWIFDILFIYLLSYLIFQTKIYKHQKISIIIIIFAGLVLDIIANNYHISSETIFPIIIKFLCEIFLSLSIIINKYTMEKKFCPAYELCFYQGLITLIFFSIFSIFTTIFNFYDNYKKYFNDINKKNKNKEIFMTILIMILQFFLNLCIFATIEKTTSFHVMIIIIIGELVPYIKKLTNNRSNKLINVLIILDLCFILFMTLIFNEIIIINCFGMQKNTKKYISYRAEKEEASEIISNAENDAKIDEDNESNIRKCTSFTEEMLSFPDEKKTLNDW